MTGRLDGKVAIITGASTGLGPVMGALFVREGAKVLLAARREELVRDAAARGRSRRHRDARRRDRRGRRRGHGGAGGRRVRPRRHPVQQRRRARTGPLDLGADAGKLERHHRHRRHRRDAVHPRGAQPVDVAAPPRRDPELLLDGRLLRHGPQDALRHRQGVAAGVHQGRRARGRPARHPVQLHRARRHRHRAVAQMGATHRRRAGRRLRRPSARNLSKASRCRIFPHPRTSPTWRCSWPATKAAPSPANRSPSTPEGTCRDEPSRQTVGGHTRW